MKTNVEVIVKLLVPVQHLDSSIDSWIEDIAKEEVEHALNLNSFDIKIISVEPKLTV